MSSDRAQETADQFQQNQATKQLLGRLWIRNVFRNYLHIGGFTATDDKDHNKRRIGGANCIYSCADIKTDLPVILIGAGISLEEELSHINELTDSHCLVAVDTALPILRTYGIEPDLVVAMESQVYNMRDFLSGIDSRTIVAMDITAHPSLLRILLDQKPMRKVALFSSQFADINLLRLLDQHGLRPLTVPALGSVGVVALYIALMLTIREIYVVGLDFSYKMGKTHCRGAPFLSTAHRMTSILNPDPIYRFCVQRSPLTMRDKNGINSRTEPPLINSNRLLQKICAHHTRIYDCGNEGLYMNSKRARLMTIIKGATMPQNDSDPPNDYQTTTGGNISFKTHANGISYTTVRAFIASLHDQIKNLLALNEQQYEKLFVDYEEPSTIKQHSPLVTLNFLVLDYAKKLPLAQHHRYSALDYHRRLTRYLQCRFYAS